jgi:hypothetical protein
MPENKPRSAREERRYRFIAPMRRESEGRILGLVVRSSSWALTHGHWAELSPLNLGVMGIAVGSPIQHGVVMGPTIGGAAGTVLGHGVVMGTAVGLSPENVILETAVRFIEQQGTELESLQRRLESLEQKLVEHQSAPVKRKDEEKGKGSSKEQSSNDGEDSPMETAVVNSNSIALAVQSYEIQKTPAWESVSITYPGVKLFAIDADPRTFQVSEDGIFDGKANILVSIPKKTRTGRETNFSLTIATRVFGELSPDGHIKVSEFKLAPSR